MEINLAQVLRHARDDRVDEAHECWNTGDENAMIAERRVVDALTHALEVVLAELPDYEVILPD